MADDPCNFSVWSQAVFLGISQHTVDYATTVKQSLKSPDGFSVTVADSSELACVFSFDHGNLVFQGILSFRISNFDRSGPQVSIDLVAFLEVTLSLPLSVLALMVSVQFVVIYFSWVCPYVFFQFVTLYSSPREWPASGNWYVEKYRNKLRKLQIIRWK